jgi:MFS family permease
VGYNSFLYNVFYLLHLTAAIVGFGSSFVWPALAAKARARAPQEPGTAYAINRSGFEVASVLTAPFIWASGAFGIILVVLSDDLFDFGQTWISLAFLLFFGAALFALFVHTPNLRAMLTLQERLVSGEARPPASGGPPPEVAELQARGKRAGMYGGILHLLFLLLMIDMVWKPGAPAGF